MTQQTSSTRRFWLGGKRAAEQDRFFREALEPLGWQQGDEHDWDAGWVTGMPDAAQFRKVSPQCKLNHFPGNAALTVKSRLHDSLAALRERIHAGHGADSEAAARLAFFPRAYLMPRDYHLLQETALANPERRWILKPTNASKGKGVRVLRDVAEAPLARDWLVQEYLANPHTIRGHKYVLRLYVLISSLEPLRVYLYRQGFAKLASERWDPEDADNPYSQLTNPDINALNERAEVPVEFIDLDRYRTWLRDQGHDDAALFARIEDLVALTTISAVDAMRRRTAEAGADPRGCYELLGLDCLVDETLKPWILECNLSPSLGICAGPESGGRIEEAVKGGLVRDLVSLLDIAGERGTLDQAHDGGVDTARLLDEVLAERARAGGYQPLLPSTQPERYLPFFSLPTLADLQLAEGMAEGALARPRLQRRQVAELLEGEHLALYATETGAYYRPNDTAALIWLLATDGLDPDAIAEVLAQAVKGDAALDSGALRREVWETVGEWCRAGLLCQMGESASAGIAEERTPPIDALRASPPVMRLDVDGRHWVLEVGSMPALTRLSAAFGERMTPLDDIGPSQLPRLTVLCEPQGGYALAADAALVASRLTLTQLVPALTGHLLRQTATPEQPVLDAGLLFTGEGEGVLCLLPDDQAGREWLDGLQAVAKGVAGRGVRLPATLPGRVETLALPMPGVSIQPSIQPRSAWPAGVEVRGVLVASDAPDGEPLTTLSGLDALAVLLPRIVTADGRSPGGPKAQELAAWLAGVPCHRVAVGERAPSPERLAGWLASLADAHDTASTSPTLSRE